jgi:hypothetical protein
MSKTTQTSSISKTPGKGQAAKIYEFLSQEKQSLNSRLIRIKKQNQQRSSTQIFVLCEIEANPPSAKKS